MTKEKWMPTAVLSAICLVVAGLLATINLFTGPRIEQNQAKKALGALAEVYPDGVGFEKLDLSSFTMPPSVVEGYSEASGGYVFRMNVKGKSEGMIVMCGVDAEGRIVGVKCIEDAETDSYFASVQPVIEGEGKYLGASDAQNLELVKIAGATLSSNGYHAAVKDALLAFAVVGGANVDFRTPEQIAEDSCNEAMGTTDVTYEKWFACEALEGVSAAYIGNGGTVLVIEGSYVAVKDGAVVGTLLAEGVESVDEAVALAADTVIAGATLTTVQKPEGVSSTVKNIWVSGSGNYVFEVRVKGYSQGNGHYVAPDAAPIVVKVCIDTEGKILSTLTVSHKESKDYGAACGSPDYYEQYNGKTEATYNEVPTITGASITSRYYKDAIKYAFAAFEILTGGAQS